MSYALSGHCAPLSRLRAYVPPAAAALLTLETGACRWPLGEVADATFRFCAAPRKGGSYCALHARLAGRSR